MLKNSIENRLQEQPEKFDFFQAVKMLEHDYNSRNQSYFSNIFQNLNFDNSVSFLFSPSSLHSVFKSENNVWHITSGLEGLYGPHGDLPDFFISAIINNKTSDGFPVKDFLDIFNKKLLFTRYQANKKYKFYVHHEISHKNTIKTDFEKLLFCLVGFFHSQNNKKLFENEKGLIRFAPYFNKNNSPTTEKLKKIILDYFSLPVTITEYVGKWETLDKSECTMLSCQKHTLHRLGENTFLGRNTYSTHQRVNIILGPLSYKQYLWLFPNEDRIKKIRELIHVYLGMAYTVAIQLLITAKEIPTLKLGTHENSRLGWNTWLGLGEKQNLLGLKYCT